MLTRHRMLAVATLVALCSITHAALAADAPKTTMPAAAAPSADAQAAMMAQMMKDGTPGPMHAALKNHVGTWNAAVTTWMGGPQPVNSTGSETREMILGGRFLATKFTGTFMGQPYEGWGLTGYDNHTGKAMQMWADNMATSWMSLTGTMSADGKTMSCTGTELGMDGKPMDIRAETKFDSDTQMTYTMYGKMNGQDTKMMEIVYTKATTAADAQPTSK